MERSNFGRELTQLMRMRDFDSERAHKLIDTLQTALRVNRNQPFMIGGNYLYQNHQYLMTLGFIADLNLEGKLNWYSPLKFGFGNERKIFLPVSRYTSLSTALAWRYSLNEGEIYLEGGKEEGRKIINLFSDHRKHLLGTESKGPKPLDFLIGEKAIAKQISQKQIYSQESYLAQMKTLGLIAPIEIKQNVGKKTIQEILYSKEPHLVSKENIEHAQLLGLNEGDYEIEIDTGLIVRPKEFFQKALDRLNESPEEDEL